MTLGTLCCLLVVHAVAMVFSCFRLRASVFRLSRSCPFAREPPREGEFG